MNKYDREEMMSNQHRDEMEHKAKVAGYESAYEQALDYIQQEMPGSINPEKTAHRVVEIAAKEKDSISRVVGMRNY